MQKMQYIIPPATIVIFVILFCITEFVNNNDLYLGSGGDWPEVKKNNKIILQSYIFMLGLPCFLLLTDFIFNKRGKIWRRMVITLSVSWFVYFLTWHIFQKWGNTNHLSMYHHPRGIPAFMWCFMNIIIILHWFPILWFFKHKKKSFSPEKSGNFRITRR